MTQELIQILLNEQLSEKHHNSLTFLDVIVSFWCKVLDSNDSCVYYIYGAIISALGNHLLKI